MASSFSIWHWLLVLLVVVFVFGDRLRDSSGKFPSRIHTGYVRPVMAGVAGLLLAWLVFNQLRE